MKNLILLQLSSDKRILIRTYNEEEPIFMFDEILIEYYSQDKSNILYHDFLCEGMKAFVNILKNALTNKLQLDVTLKKHGIGYQWNIQCNNIYNDYDDGLDTVSKYNVWSGVGNKACDTWLFNDNGKIFIEISPTYNFEYYTKKDFQEFLDEYKAILTIEINRESAEQWLREGEWIVQTMKK